MSNKKKYTIACLGLIAGLVILIVVVLGTRDAAAMDNPIENLNYDRSQILVTGIDYQLNYEQEKEIEKEQEEKEKKQEEQKIQETSAKSEKGEAWQQAAPGAGGTGNGDSDKKPDGGGSTDEPEDVDTSMLPVITTSVKDGDSVGVGYYAFNVIAADYKGQSISRQFFDVYVNGEKTYSSGMNDYKAIYSFDIVEGANTISIKVTDEYGHIANKKYVLYGDASTTPETKGTVTISINASNVGLGYIVPPTEVGVYRNENVAHVLVRLLNEKGISYTNTGTVGYGFYLARIYKPGITNGWKIPDALLSRLNEMGVTEMGHDLDSLGEMDFYRYSGWYCYANGEDYQVGISSVPALDGDEIEIWFTTHMGEDYGGNWH